MDKISDEQNNDITGIYDDTLDIVSKLLFVAGASYHLKCIR
jgi:hypothetical protein